MLSYPEVEECLEILLVMYEEALGKARAIEQSFI